MPYYDLECSSCGSVFNKQATMAEKTGRTITCPDCGSVELETVFKTANVIIKKDAPACPNAHVCGAGCRHAS